MPNPPRANGPPPGRPKRSFATVSIAVALSGCASVEAPAGSCVETQWVGQGKHRHLDLAHGDALYPIEREPELFAADPEARALATRGVREEQAGMILLVGGALSSVATIVTSVFASPTGSSPPVEAAFVTALALSMTSVGLGLVLGLILGQRDLAAALTRYNGWAQANGCPP